LKSDERTSHIPIILLTARAAKADKIEGFETGADDYIPKPFDADELLVRIKNLIEQRRKLRERFSREVFLNPEKIAITSMDEVFLKRAMDIAQENISDPEFGVDFFSKKIGLSRSQLHRKIHALTDQSVSQFIRSLRLRKAVQLLEKRAGTISEIAYQVGFNSSAYFTKCFHEQFKLSPSDYMSQQNIDYH
jgi:AraC-like DNA-binding protein